MKALIIKQNSEMEIGKLLVPKYNEYQALVKMKSCGICGTDIKILHNKLRFFNNYPTVLGHEGVGQVIEIGKKVKNFKTGDIVTSPFNFGKNKGNFMTWGALAEYAVIGDIQALIDENIPADNPLFLEVYYGQKILPGEIDPVKGAIVITLREVYSATQRLGFYKGQSLLVFGAGSVGLSFIKMAKLIGMEPIICVDIKDLKLESAKKLGADVVLNSKKSDIVYETKKLLEKGVDQIIEAAGVVSLINTSVNLVAKYGSICVYGISPEQNTKIDWSNAPYNFNIKFIQWPIKKQEGQVHDKIITWIKQKKICCDDFISDIYDFDKAVEAIKKLEQGQAEKKIIIKF